MSRSAKNISDGKLLINNPSQLHNLTEFTFASWIKLEELPASDTCYIADFGGKKTISVDTEYKINVEVSRVTINDILSTPSGIIPLNEWTHIVFTYKYGSPSELHLYMTDTLGNWREIGTMVSGIGALNSDSGLSVAFLNTYLTGSFNFPGSIAEVGVWNRILTIEEIQHLSIDRYTPSLIRAGIIGAWKLNGGNPEIDYVYGNNAYPSTDLLITDNVPMILEDEIGPISSTILYAPNLTSPVGEETFNKGFITISWEIKDPPSSNSSVELSDITYEIEYTDNYIGRETVWHTVKKRIEGETTSYLWYIGKMLKSETLRIRIRSFYEYANIFSEYSPSASSFTVNVFKLVTPVILSPLSGNSYIDSITIILDENNIEDTYNQKIYYKIEYQSTKSDIDWTVLYDELPVGSTTIRWNIDGLPNSDDYQLKLTSYDKNNNQYATTYVDKIKISHPGLFYIDTLPPVANIEFENTNQVTNKLDHIVNIYAEDSVTDIKTISFSDINLTDTTDKQVLTLGPVQESNTDKYFSPIQILPCDSNVFQIGNTPKIQWTFADKSGLMRLNSVFTDYGNNTSCNILEQFFVKLWKYDEKMTDFISVREDRDYLKITNGNIGADTKRVNTVYVSTENGKIYRVEPFPIQIYDIGIGITKLSFLYDVLYVFSYNNNTDVARAYRDDKTDSLYLLTEFTDPISKITAVCQYGSYLYIGMENGQLWIFDGASFTKIHTFDNPINYLTGDSRYLYIGFFSGTNIVLYNGSSFFALNIEV
jgi:hypothetical protein